MVSSEALTAPEEATDSSDGLTIPCGASRRWIAGHLPDGPYHRAQTLPLGEPAGEGAQRIGAHGQAAALPAAAHVVEDQRQPAPAPLGGGDGALQVAQRP